MSRVETGPGWSMHLGRWQEALAHVAECDALITDPPYSERTHSGQRHGRQDEREDSPYEYASSRGLGYAHWTPADVGELTGDWSDRCRGWFCAFTSHDMAHVYASTAEACGRYAFAPLSCVQIGMNIRLAGDGPSNWTTWLCVNRPRTLRAWGTLRGAYVGNPFDPGENTATASRRKSVVGSKPLWLMRAIIRDYTRPGDLVVDPCAGGGTTLLAAVMEGRRAIGAEMDPATFDKAVARLRKGFTTPLPGMEAPRMEQTGLDLGGTP